MPDRDSGAGKSHLLIGLGTAAAQAGHRVRYVLAAKLVNELVEAADQRQLSRTIARYGRVDLLCLDLSRARDYAVVWIVGCHPADCAGVLRRAARARVGIVPD